MLSRKKGNSVVNEGVSGSFTTVAQKKSSSALELSNGSGGGFGTAATTSEKGLKAGARVKNPAKSSSLGISILQYLYLLRYHSRRHILEKVLLLLALIIKGTRMRLRGAMDRAIDRAAFAGKVQKANLLLTVFVRTLGHSGRTLSGLGWPVHFLHTLHMHENPVYFIEDNR